MFSLPFPSPLTLAALGTAPPSLESTSRWGSLVSVTRKRGAWGTQVLLARWAWDRPQWPWGANTLVSFCHGASASLYVFAVAPSR